MARKKNTTFKSVDRKVKILIWLTVLALVLQFVLPAYQDWRNKRLLQSLPGDFISLINEIETDASASLNIISNCSGTSEKFTEAKRTCELRVSKVISAEGITQAKKSMKNTF